MRLIGKDLNSAKRNRIIKQKKKTEAKITCYEVKTIWKRKMQWSRIANLKLRARIGGEFRGGEEEMELDRKEIKLPQCPWRETRVPRGRARTRGRKRLLGRSLSVSRWELAAAKKRRRCLRIPPTMVPSSLSLSLSVSRFLSLRFRFRFWFQIWKLWRERMSEWVRLSVGLLWRQGNSGEEDKNQIGNHHPSVTA